MKSNVFNKILKVFKPVLLLVLIFFLTQLIYGQQSDLTEQDIIKQAEKLFDAKDYQGAIPLYAQLVSVHPDEPLYNYRFGVCTLFGDRKDKKKPIRYLSYAALSMTDNPELFYNLGLAFHQNQEFANAMKYYNLYLAKLAPNAPERAKILEKVNACVNGLTLEHKHLISEIISKSEFQKDNFHRAYKSEDLNGSLVIKPDMFKSGKEKKSGEQSFVFISEPRTVLYYSGYDDDANSKDIFKVELNEKGDWGKPEKISEIINTPFDEDYPVLTDYGTTLYFCSEGHNSLGGFDIFKAKLDTASNTFSQPENMGAGINSPFDDILFVLDKENKCAYFASDRDNLNGSINVFKVRLIGSEHENQHFLAHEQNLKNAFPEKKEVNTNTQSESQNLIAKNENIQKEQTTPEQQTSNPSEKAATMMSDRTKSHKLADSAYLVIARTKTLVRDLTNKRDRANAISKRKGDEAKELERRFDETVVSLTYVKDEEEFKKTLDKSVKLKEEICQLYQRSTQANTIAWNLGRQIKTKNKELEDLKGNAGKIQTTSVSGTYEETLILYTSFKNLVSAADTLAEFSDRVMAITNDEATYEIPESEFAFAERLLDGFKNNTLLAEVKSTKPVIDENVPIVVVDNRTHVSENSVKDKPRIIDPVKQVQEINYEEILLASSEEIEEQLEVNYDIDYELKPLPLIVPIHHQLLAYGEIEPDETELQLSFFIDRVDPLKVVKQFDLYQLTYNDESIGDPNDIEINFMIDKINALNIVSQVDMDALAFNSIEPDEMELDINSTIDMIEPYQLVDQIELSQLAFNDFTIDEDTELEINSDIDRIEAFDLVPQINTGELAFNSTESDESYLEINLGIDQVEALNLVSEISIYDLAFNTTEPDETNLEINLGIDQVEAIKLADQFELNQLAFNEVSIDENLDIEINSTIDQVEALNLVSQINTEELAFNTNDPDETYLEINLGIDQVEAIGVVDQIETTQLAMNDLSIDESLDININSAIDQVEAIDVVDQIETTQLALNDVSVDESLDIEINSTIDQVEALNMVSQINNEELAFNTTDPDETYLEIDLGVDQIEAIDIVDQIETIQLAMNDVSINESLDININSEIDQVIAVNIVPQINTEELVFNANDPDETYLEINLGIDQVEAIGVVDQIESTQLAMNDLSIDESLDININSAIDQVSALNIVSQISTEELAINTTDPDETYLEMDLGIDQIEAIEVVDQIETTQLVLNDVSINESLDININSAIDQVSAVNIVSQISTEKLTFNTTDPDETNLEIDLGIDQVEAFGDVNQIETSQIAFSDISIDENIEVKIENQVEIFKPLDLVAQISTTEYENTFIGDTDIELNFNIDTFTPIEIVNPIAYSELAYSTNITTENDLEIDFNIDDNSSSTVDEVLLANTDPIEDSQPKNFEAERNNFMYYLRESVTKAGTIETSKSDFELLRFALSEPDELSYEELLYAATLAQTTRDKLTIYGAAFIHIDRDWRAFNNAAITSIHGNNLDQADVYLYQASLISMNNGKIQNNMGILACYKKEFDKAEDHFIAATELGFDAYYNLQVVNNIVDATTEIADNIIINTDIDTHEVIGDIIDYGTSPEE